MPPSKSIPSRAAARPTSWWLSTLERRAARMNEERLDLSQPIAWRSEAERRAAIKFFNAAFRAEESGLKQAHELGDLVGRWDPALGDVLRLYGNEEGWHRELLTEFLAFIGGGIEPMGRVTRSLYRLYGRATRMESIVLTNLMFETIGSTTYRMALGRVRHPAARQILTILTRDESFHVPLNVHFLRNVLERASSWERLRLNMLYNLLFLTLVALPLASRPKARAFDGIGVRELSRAYARYLAGLFAQEPELGLKLAAPVPWLFGLTRRALSDKESVVSVQAAERAATRENVDVTAL